MPSKCIDLSDSGSGSSPDYAVSFSGYHMYTVCIYIRASTVRVYGLSLVVSGSSEQQGLILTSVCSFSITEC